MKKFIKITFHFFVYVFAVIGFGLTGMYFAVKWHLTDSSGKIDEQRGVFLQNISATSQTAAVAEKRTILTEKIQTTEEWQSTPEWDIVKSAIQKDHDVVFKVAYNLDLPPRYIITPVIAEQMRYFNTDRELFKRVFAPLKILGNLTQFSWGVSGVKEQTAIQIENNLKDKNSPYYLGESFEHLLDFKTANVSQERFERITDKHDRYYAYLYAGIFMKQIINEWKIAGYDISERPDILATLYNIGFAHSAPNATPEVGGSIINIGSKAYSFGSLAGSFFESSELEMEFPKTLGIAK